jgi:hypothetical protein
MKIFINAPGDMSVGIWPDHVEIIINRDLPKEDTEREETRKLLSEFWNDFLDNGGITVRFEDECPDCGKKMPYKRLVDGVGCYKEVWECYNPHCFGKQ